MKRIISCIWLVIFLNALRFPANALSVSAQYACVLDAQTGKVLYEKNAYQTHSMASTTKIMTALLALEHTKPDELVTVSKNAAGTEGSSMYLAAFETLTMQDLLYGLMLQSGNDAAIAIAEHVGGSVENFAKMMTERAHAIGAKNTAFQNPNGLDAKGHYTTAYDLALITREALQNPDFAEIVATKKKSLPQDEDSKARSFANHNKLLSLYPGCIGVKTGFTKKTGRCLVSAATQNHATVICVTLNAPNDWNDHTNMLNYGFSQLSVKPLVLKDMILKSIPVTCGASKTVELLAAEDFYLSHSDADTLSKIKLDYKLPAEVTAPIAAGTQLGKLTVLYDGKKLCEMDLLAGASIDYVEPPKPTLRENFKKFFLELLNIR
ncbi:MAG: D-alanyl-D-alanine carboxypeptidase [Ruminococcaceae bacterium]|nr:D-alanyl-D-alanine carboxypeptidase [Oscillospiraceae bacterium]